MNIFLCLLLSLCLAFSLQAQTRQELEAERIKINNQIQASSKKLSTIEKTKKESHAQLRSLKENLKKKEESAVLLQKNLKGLDAKIQTQKEILAALEEDLSKQKIAYKKNIALIYKYKRTLPQPINLFLPQYWEDIYRIQGYLTKLENLRRTQLSIILQTQESINQRKLALEAHKSNEDLSLQKTIKEKESFANKASAQDQLVKKLSSEEQQIRKEIDRAQKSKNQLNNKIESVIRDEIAQAKNNARNYETAVGNTPTTNKNTANTATANTRVMLTPQEESKLTKGILANKGKLHTPAWGKVINEYGKKQHPDLPLVIIENNGVDIQTAANASVFAIYEGIVVNTFTIPGIGNAIMLKHGEFYSIYAGINNSKVSSGQKVNTKQVIANVAKDNASSNYVLHFEIWKNKQKENPRHWIKL